MKVQISGKEYVSNLEGLGFESMLPHFFRPMRWRGKGGRPTRKRTGVVGPCGGGYVVGPLTKFG
jgi:hypothetical protein